MIKQYVKFLPLLLTVGVLLLSCNNKMNRGSDKITFDSIRVNKTVYLLGDTALPSCNVSINYTYPVFKDSTLCDSLNFYLAQACFGSDIAEKVFVNVSSPDLVHQYVRNYTERYIREVQPLYVEEIKEHPQDKPQSFGWFSYYDEVVGSVQFCNSDLLVYKCYINEFTGGAHGVYFTTFLNYDFKLNRILHLNDIFTGDYQEPVSNMLWETLMKRENVKSREELEDKGYGSLGAIEPIENFYISPQGITFYYNIYDIAPFSMGATEVTLSFAQLKPWLGHIKAIEKLAK